MSYLKAGLRWFTPFLLVVLALPSVAFAADAVVVDKIVETAPKLRQSHTGIPQIDIVKPKEGISHNRFEQFNFVSKGIVINNSRYGDDIEGAGHIGPNKNLTETAKTIVFEVTGTSQSELQGAATIAGDKSEFILVNPNGIVCNGCSFINAHNVILRTDKLHSVVDGAANWEKDLKGTVSIGKDGTLVRDGSLVLSSGKIKIEGAIAAKDLLRAEAHSAKTTNNTEVEQGKYAINISTVALITAGKIYLVATGEGAGIKIAKPALLPGATNTVVTTKDDLNIEAKGSIDIEAPLSSANHIRIKGGDLSVYQKVNAAKAFQVNGNSFVNDNEGNISAGSIEVYLTGKMADGNSLSQKSASILEAKDGDIKVIAPNGGVYFGYKQEFTGAGDNKDGFNFIGSQVLSHSGAIHIQSGGNVVFDGAQTLGEVTVEATGEIIEKNPTGSYKNGMDNIKHTENKVRTIMKGETRTRPVTIKENKVRTVNKPVTKTRQVFDHTECWCPSGVSIFGGCVGGPKCKDHYRTESYIEQVPTQENYVQESTIQESYIEQVPVQEQYVEETITLVPHFQEVTLNTNFVGGKRFSTNKEDIVFNEGTWDKFAEGEYLKFVTLADYYEYRKEL